MQPAPPSFSDFASLGPLPDDAPSPPPVPLSPLCTPKKRGTDSLSSSRERLRSSSPSPIRFLPNSSDYPVPPPTAEEFAATVAADKKRWAAETLAELDAYLARKKAIQKIQRREKRKNKKAASAAVREAKGEGVEEKEKNETG